jgi:MFS family permease
MLREFGAGSCFIVTFFVIAGLNQILVVAGVPAFSLGMQLLLAAIPTAAFAMYVRTLGRPMFILLLLVMVLLATTELGTDSWIADIMNTVLASPTKGTLFLVWTSLIMFILRFFAGPIVHRIGPLGLLAASAGVAAIGLLWLGNAGTAPWVLFAAATFYGFGKTFFWPTTLGVVSEQYPRGGALMLNAIAGVGMISVGTIGNPLIGAVQDSAVTAEVRAADPALATAVISERAGVFGASYALDPAKRAQLVEREAAATGPEKTTLADQLALLTRIDSESKQGTLARIAILPTLMFVCYIGLIAYFAARGGYRPKSILEEDKDSTTARRPVPAI